MLAALIPAIMALISKGIDKAVPDAGEAQRLKTELSQQVNAMAATELQGAIDIIKAEAGSSHALTALWRPMLMLVFTAIIANNYILAPYLAAMFDWSVMLDLPDRFWDLLNLGVGGYVAGRSIEKGIGLWKDSAS